MDERFSNHYSNTERFGDKRNGVFKCAYKFEYPLYAAATAAAAILVPLIFNYFLNYNLTRKVEGELNAGGAGGLINGLLMFALIIIVIAAWAFGLAFIRVGEEYTYWADSEKFTLKFPHDRRPQLVVRYDRPVRLFYSDRTFFGKKVGINVTVEVPEGTFVFRCINNSLTASAGRKSLPFYIIEERTEKKPEFRPVITNEENPQ